MSPSLPNYKLSSMDELERSLMLLQNKTRRSILERLVREPHYPMQLADLIGVSQQAIVKHLKELERGNLVEKMKVPSEKGGPPRTIFRVCEAFSLRVDLGPDLFKIERRKLPSGGPLRLSSRLPGGAQTIAEMVSGRKKISVTEGVVHLEQLNEQLEQLDRQRDALIALHQQIRGRVSAAVDTDFEDYSQRTMVHALIETPRVKPDLGLMAKELNLSESDISAVMSRVRELVEQQRSERSGEVVAIDDNPGLRWWLG